MHPISYAIKRNQHDYPYANITMVKERLSELGIRYYRIDALMIPSDWPAFKDIYESHGIKPNYVIHDIHLEKEFNFLKEYASIAASIEGPNESDYWQLKYKNKTFPEGTVLYHNDLHK